jgi:hypothetical protein
VPLLCTHELTTALTTTMTTVGLHDTSTYTTTDLYRAWSSYRPVTTDQKVRGSNPFACAHVMSRGIVDGCPGTSLHFSGCGVVRI